VRSNYSNGITIVGGALLFMMTLSLTFSYASYILAQRSGEANVLNPQQEGKPLELAKILLILTIVLYH